MTKKIQLALPDTVHAALVSAAAERGCRTGDLIIAGIESVLNPKPLPKPRRVRKAPSGASEQSPLDHWIKWRAIVADLHSRGWSDRDMTTALVRDFPDEGWTRARVGDMRRRQGLAPNKPVR